jgi:hypothetical protein
MRSHGVEPRIEIEYVRSTTNSFDLFFCVVSENAVGDDEP